MAYPYDTSETHEVRHITYSRQGTIAAFTSYYEFLTAMYMDHDVVECPPASGWPQITINSMKGLGKTDEVVELLRRLPYIRQGSQSDIQSAGACRFADWTRYAPDEASPVSPETAEAVLRATQSIWEHIPSHVVGLVDSRDYQMLLDTRLGVVYLVGTHASPGPIRKRLRAYPAIKDDPTDYAPDEELDWREGGGSGRCAWSIPEFFEMLKSCFRELKYIPLGREEVEEDFDRGDPEFEVLASGRAAVFPKIREIFGQHGWPQLEQYRKVDCIAAVEKEWSSFCERVYGLSAI